MIAWYEDGNVILWVRQGWYEVEGGISPGVYVVVPVTRAQVLVENLRRAIRDAEEDAEGEGF